jgi:hypothetical protein
LFDRLSIAERQALGRLGNDPDCYGILRPKDARRSVKSVSRDTALLLFTLQSASRLPQYVIESLGRQCEPVIGQMVLDEILEIEVNGEFVSGPAACEVFLGEQAPTAHETLPAALSHDAIEYADALGIVNPAELSARLYMYNRVPASRRWRRLFPNEESVEAHLGIHENATVEMLERRWLRLPPQTATGWFAWQSLKRTHGRGPAPIFKLYVSPACDEARTTFQIVAEVVADSAAFYWKAGNSLYGLLRPDKMVVYFFEFAEMQATAARLLEKLDGCAAQGVPFTAGVDAGGLLSWGIDPSPEGISLQPESWRVRLCNLLGAALVLAKTTEHDGVSTVRFAKERLRMEGVDPSTWAPTSSLAWGAAAET